MHKKKILLLSIDDTIKSSILDSLGKKEYDMDYVKNEDIGLAKAIHLSYDFIVYDKNNLNHPEKFIKIIRDNTVTTPIILLVNKLYKTIKIECLEAGADILVDKTELEFAFVQIKAFIRRFSPEKEENILVKNLQLNGNKLEAIYKNKKIPLRKKEFALLAYLASHPNTVFSRDHLYKTIWNKENLKSNTIDTHINLLRKKLGETTNAFIRTIHAKGYAIII
jgi:DNA-binding response OmpR family regulator